MSTSTTAQQVGRNVRAEMARRRITGVALAEATGLSQSAMARRLAGLHPFSVDQLAAVAAHLGVPMSVLLPDELAKAS